MAKQKIDETHQVEDAACGCPRYDQRPGIIKVHGKDCADAAKPKAKPKARKK